jgi:endonuclease-3
VPSPSKTERIQKLLRTLAETYPEAHCELVFSNPLELLMATILSAQCTDVRVNQVTQRLFERCRTAQDYLGIPQDELEALVQPTGFFRSKARHLKGCAKGLVEGHQGEVPAAMEALIQLPGVGRKTANVVLGDAFKTPAGVVVDTHVQRLAERLGLTKEKTAEKIELALMKLIPREHWAVLSHWLIWHGRRRCRAIKPDCAHCEVSHLCPSSNKDASKIGRKSKGPAKMAKSVSKP